MSSASKGIKKVEVAVKWDPSPLGEPDIDLDIIAGTYHADDPHGAPAYLVHFDSRSPDGTIVLNRDSRTGKGLGFDEVMTLELDRLSERYSRVVVGIAIQQRERRMTFDGVDRTGYRIREGYDDLATGDFSDVAQSTAATIAVFTRGDHDEWHLDSTIKGFDADPSAFTALMGRNHS